MPMDELLALYGYGNTSQPPPPAPDPAPSNSASCSVVSSSSSSDVEDETSSVAAAGEDGQFRSSAGGLLGADTPMHTSRLLRCNYITASVNKTNHKLLIVCSNTA